MLEGFRRRGYHGGKKLWRYHDMDEQRNDIIEGRNAVQEALRAGRAIDKIYIARGETLAP